MVMKETIFYFWGLLFATRSIWNLLKSRLVVSNSSFYKIKLPMSPIDEFAIDRAPDVRPTWTTPLEWGFTLINILMIVLGIGSTIWCFGWIMTDGASLDFAPVLFTTVAVLNCWYTYKTTIPLIRFYTRWRYASKIYATTWVKERIREFRQTHLNNGYSVPLLGGIFPWGCFLYIQLNYKLPAWSWGLWGLFLLWSPFQSWYLARINRLSALVLTTKAPSSRSRFAPRHSIGNTDY